MPLSRTFKNLIRGLLRPGSLAIQSRPPKDFDPAIYLKANPDVAVSGADPLEHFLRHGIAEGRVYKEVSPSRLPADFNARAYVALNPELRRAPISPEQHYLEHGQRENRRYQLADLKACFGQEARIDRQTVLIVSHDASRTGAPILSWNLVRHYCEDFNVVVLLLGSGGILEAFQRDAHATYVYPDMKALEGVADLVIKELVERHPVQFAIVNSAEASSACRPLTLNGIPSVCLIHEFASSTSNLSTFENAARWASRLVFSTSITRDNAVQVTGLRRFSDADIAPQGRCLVPESSGKSQASKRHPIEGILESLTPEHRLVVGLGSVCYRKGVDTFIECARLLAQMPDGEKFRFVWIGSGLSPAYEPPYAMLLPDQIARSGLGSALDIVEDTDDLDVVYNRADVLLLSSRLDPLPNVAIDALHLGLPVVCFDQCSGIAEALKHAGLAQDHVAPYYDVGALAKLAWTASTRKRTDTGIQPLKDLAQKEFSMASYGQKLLRFSSQMREESLHLASDVGTIQESGLFDLDYFLAGLTATQPTARQDEMYQSIFRYCVESRSGYNRRKPRPGLHPLAFLACQKVDTTNEPFAHFIHQMANDPTATASCLPRTITPKRDPEAVAPISERVALHIHVHYLDLLPDILERVAQNATRPDLFFTATDNAPLQGIQELLIQHGLVAQEVVRVDNLGRNILPLYLTLKKTVPHYDLIGHVHTKKSAFHHHQDAIGRWRELVLCNVLGGRTCPTTADQILQQFQNDPELAIVFPDDPNILDWGDNLELACDLMGLPASALAQHFEFPVSAMFWARSSYLERFTQLAAMEGFSMQEPIPNDGTLLHAFERVLGAMLANTPSRIGLTFTPGVYR